MASKGLESPRLIIPVASTDHALGLDDAPVTLLEYGDYECPHCGQAYPIIKRLKETLGDRLRVIYRHFPQNSVHPHASVAAQAAEAAHAQGKFWAMHDQLFEHQKDLADDLTAYAIRAGLEIYKFQADLSSERHSRKVRADYDGGVQGGVHKTPTIFLNGNWYSGPLEYEAILTAIQKLL